MANFEFIDNGLMNMMNQSATIVIHSLSTLMFALSVIGTTLCVISLINRDENPTLCIVATILCVFLLLLSIFAPFVTKESNTIQTYKAKPTEDATIEDMLDFEMRYEIITKEDGWYIVREK